ncbi:hypothetical protein [Sphingomonas sp. AX6]|uniref:hypothetical protein n=1 Tax=Sphingomonas sp. AX6 TaxID=2653171 RepID=UPI0012F3B455|nr:hypothetical protein [Sphingomonas sp. AX6]VXC96753.1 conserved hypothetical protein [Sphingomonas sp. AX6]
MLVSAVVLAAIGLPIANGPTRADSPPSGAGTVRTENARSIDVVVQGRIAQRCAIGDIPNTNFGNLERPGLGMSARVALDCNIPFDMEIKATNGGLTHRTMPGGQGPYAGMLPYSLGVEFPVRRPQASMVSQRFESRQLRGSGGVVSSLDGIATQGMTISVDMGQPQSEAGLLAGEYSETITITIAPR